MSLDLGWGRETFSFAIALQNLVWGLAMPVAGAIADRFGGARVLIAGGLAYGLGLWAMAYSTHPLAFDLAAGLLVGLGLACTGFGVVLAVVARAFPPEKRSVAVGIAASCDSFGQFVMLPWGQALISRFGWLNALLVLGACAFVMIPLGTSLATVPLTNSLVGQIFGVKYLSTLFSIAFLGHQLGAFIGAWAGGAAFDLAGSYLPVWLAAIALSVIAAALCMLIDERAIERQAFTGAA